MPRVAERMSGNATKGTDRGAELAEIVPPDGVGGTRPRSVVGAAAALAAASFERIQNQADHHRAEEGDE